MRGRQVRAGKGRQPDTWLTWECGVPGKTGWAAECLLRRYGIKEIKRLEGRRWDAASKAWFVPSASKAEAVEILSKFFEVVDAEKVGESGVKLAKLNAMINEIIENQKYILSHKERIEELIAEKDAQVRGYSYRSTSRVKAALAADSALLWHALENATLDPSRMTELQVRGLAAAVRYLS